MPPQPTHDDPGPSAPPAPALDVLAPLAIEALAVRRGAPWATVHRVGMGARARRGTLRCALAAERPAVIAGFGGAIDEDLRPGDVVLASELRTPAGSVACADPSVLAGVLRRGGLRVRVGPVWSGGRLAVGARRRALSETGAVAVDMESAAVATCGILPPVVMRVIVDTPVSELYRPLRTVARGSAALRTLSRAAGLLEDWARALGPREVVLAAPRASCAGVVRAIEIVRRALTARETPVYVRKQIVHNAHVVSDLEREGAVFVESVDEVPAGQTLVFSAHGVSPEVRAAAAERGLDVIDATCPLVSKVHAEARRFAAAGFDIVLVGHEGHEEVEGTFGEAPEHMHVIAGVDDIPTLEVRDPRRVACLTQTTLAVDDTAQVITALQRRFPELVVPKASDICYATQNRQDAVRALAAECDVVFVVGSANSSNSRRLVEVSERAGCPALLVDSGLDVPPDRLAGVRRVGVTAGASAPEDDVQAVVRALGGLGAVTVDERAVASESVHFKLPDVPKGVTV